MSPVDINTRSPKKTLIILFLISLGLRLAVLYPVLYHEVPPLFDEAGYFSRALGFREIILDLVHMKRPATKSLSMAYGEGHWPPLHSIVLGTGLAIGGPSVGVARTVVVFMSALTTVLIFLLTAKIVNRRAAWFAAALHLLGPTFVAYSHLLWSESTCIFFLVLAIYLASDTLRSTTERQMAGRAILTGVTIGCAALTRAAVLPYVFVLTIWFAMVMEDKRSRCITSSLTLTAALIVLLPWQLALYEAEGRFLPLTTLGGYNLALGNNPWVPAELGSSWGHEASKTKLHAELTRRSRETGVTWENAGIHVAYDELGREPSKFFTRAVNRVRMLWAMDHFALRHLSGTIYPPLSTPWLVFLTLLIMVGYLFILVTSLTGAIDGIRTNLYIRLLVVLTIAGMAPAFMTIGMSRLHLPLLALLLPAAGHSLSVMFSKEGSRLIIPDLVILVLSSWHIASTFPQVLDNYLHPSSCYSSFVQPMNQIFGSKTDCFDRIFLRCGTDYSHLLKISISSANARFSEGGRERQFKASAANKISVLKILSSGDSPLEITVEDPEQKQIISFKPIQKTAWMIWQPTDFPGVSYKWACGGPIVATEQGR